VREEVAKGPEDQPPRNIKESKEKTLKGDAGGDACGPQETWRESGLKFSQGNA